MPTIHSVMPPFSQSLRVPETQPSLLTIYCGIALASSLSKVLEWSILTTWNDYFITSDLHFDFKFGVSTTLCTGVMKTACY